VAQVCGHCHCAHGGILELEALFNGSKNQEDATLLATQNLRTEPSKKKLHVVVRGLASGLKLRSNGKSAMIRENLAPLWRGLSGLARLLRRLQSRFHSPYVML